MKEGTNFKKSGETKFGRWERAIGVERPHVDDERSFVEAFGLEEYLCIWKSWMESNQTNREKGVEHGLNARAIGGLLWRGAGISQEQTARGSG